MKHTAKQQNLGIYKRETLHPLSHTHTQLQRVTMGWATVIIRTNQTATPQTHGTTQHSGAHLHQRSKATRRRHQCFWTEDTDGLKEE